jgi:glycosyltransferase A (GT-A) superfamily protein (DUF2064 family)
VISTLIVLAKRPVPGRVKTRLQPQLSASQAARVAAAALRDTLRVAADVPVRQRILAFDGDVSGWLPRGWRHVEQRSGELDVRLSGAFAAAGTGPAVLVGMDTPQLRPADLTAFDPVGYDACLGLCPDGGYWAIGFSDPRHAALAVPGIPMSRMDTGPHQYARLVELGLRVQLLSSLVDVDTIDDAVEVARIAPDSEFAQQLMEPFRVPAANCSVNPFPDITPGATCVSTPR